MLWMLLKALISAAIIVAVAEVARLSPRLGGLLLSLPTISILAFIMTWTKEGEMGVIARLAREALILVPLSLPFFIPFALSSRTGLSFWPSFVLGLVLAATSIGLGIAMIPPADSAEATAAPARVTGNEPQDARIAGREPPGG